MYTAVLVLLLGWLLQSAAGDCSCNNGVKSRDICKNDKIVVCYFTNWAWYRSGIAKFTPENINATLCTHLFYAFASLDNDTLLMTTSDSWADTDNKFYQRMMSYKKKGLKVMLSIGGWSDSLDQWHRMISNETARANFVCHAVQYLKDNGFDGLDLDYEYPGCPQGNCSAGFPEDKDNFNKLAVELKSSFEPCGFILSAALAGGKKIIEECYNMPPLLKVLDFCLVMTYDYHSYLECQTGAQTPLYGTSTSWGFYDTLKYYLEVLKCPPKKLVMGMSGAGQSYTLADNSDCGWGKEVSGPGVAGEYTSSAGFLAYYEICEKLKNGWDSGFDKINGSWACYDKQFVSYSGIQDIKVKSKWVREYCLGGVMFWALDYDDFSNNCCCGIYPLLRAINQELYCPNGTSVSCC